MPPPPPPSPPAYRQSPLTAYFCKNVSQICLQKSGLICHKKLHLRHQEVVSFTRRVRKGGASPLSPAYMIHRSQAAAASHCLANISPLLLQMFPDVRTDWEFHGNIFRGKRYVFCWRNTPGGCPGWRRRRWCWCAYPSGCCCTSPLLVLLQQEEDKAFPTNRPAPHQHRNHLVTSGPSCSLLFSRWSILGTSVVQYLGSPQPGATYFTRVGSSTSFSGDAALVTSL